MRNDVLNRNLSREQITRACHLLRDKGINVLTQNMLGLPFESVRTFWDTIALNRECKPAFLQIFIFEPYPGLKLTQTALDGGMFDGNFDGLPASYHKQVGLRLEHAKELETLAHFANLIYESRLVGWAAQALMRLPKNNRLRFRGLEWMNRHQGGLRRVLGCADTRCPDMRRFWAPSR